MERRRAMVVGIDNGGSSNNATVLNADGRFLMDRLVENPSRVQEGPAAALDALVESYENILRLTGVDPHRVVAVGLDTPGPASATGVISVKGSTNFAHPGWHGFDIRSAVAERLDLPVTYLNDGNAAALYAHLTYLGGDLGRVYDSAAIIIGTGLGGGLVHAGQVIGGASGMAGELGHVRIALDGLLADDQPMPTCACGNLGDAESVASLTGIIRNLLPYWLTRYPGHELHGQPIDTAARQVRSLAEAGDEMSLKIFEQQAGAIGRLFTVLANVCDPHVYFLGGGVVETGPAFRDWFLGRVRAHTELRSEQADASTFALVPDRDMAGARGAAWAAWSAVAAAPVREGAARG